MSGNTNQYDPTAMFAEWIQKNGKTQAEFLKNLSSIMGDWQTVGKFDPLGALAEISARAARAQTMQAPNMGQLMSLVPGLGWGAYKTSIGSNGRISIPEAERDALGLSEGDLVQVIILPVRGSKNKEVNK